MSDAGDRIFAAANSLAAYMRPHPWYRRTSMAQGRDVPPHLVVWAEFEGEPPDVIPNWWRGYSVAVRRVDDAHPCPFGSVR